MNLGLVDHIAIRSLENVGAQNIWNRALIHQVEYSVKQMVMCPANVQPQLKLAQEMNTAHLALARVILSLKCYMLQFILRYYYMLQYMRYVAELYLLRLGKLTLNYSFLFQLLHHSLRNRL